MSKDTYWFSHDFNARYDPKISILRSIYGEKGYGWFWIIIEMLREESAHRLSIDQKYSYTAFAVQMNCDKKEAEEFIDACINDFTDSEGNGLLKTDGKTIWSESLNRRLEEMEEKKRVRIERARKAGLKAAENRRKSDE